MLIVAGGAPPAVSRTQTPSRSFARSGASSSLWPRRAQLTTRKQSKTTNRRTVARRMTALWAAVRGIIHFSLQCGPHGPLDRLGMICGITGEWPLTDRSRACHSYRARIDTRSSGDALDEPAPNSDVIARRNRPSDMHPSITSSVITETCGSIKTNIRMVATPFMTDDRLPQVTRSSAHAPALLRA